MKEKNTRKIINEVKEQMIRYHRLILPESKQKKKNVDSIEFFKEKSRKLKKIYQKIDSHDEFLHFMREIRVKHIPYTNLLKAEGLLIKGKDRNEWVENMIKSDFFRVRKDPDILEAMITPQKADLATVNIGVISMIASTPHGAFYLNKHQLFLDRCLKLFKDSENGTVLQRFCLATLQKMSKIEIGSEFLFEQKFLFWIVDFLEGMNLKTTHSFMPIYLMSAFYNIICGEINEKAIMKNIYTYGKLLKRLLILFPQPLPGAFYIAVLEVIKYFQRRDIKWKEIDLESKANDTLSKYLADVEGTFKDVKIHDRFKDQIVDTMKLISGNEKPIGYYIEETKSNEKKIKKKSRKNQKEVYNWKDRDIKLFQGVLKWHKKNGYENDGKKIEFEIFKDELNF